jgi:tetratricopeptide (TPR) repeat protein
MIGRVGRLAAVRGALAILLAALLHSGAAGASEPASTADLARLRRAVEAHPDDPDLALAWAGALRDAGQGREAIAQLERVAERWPRLRAECALEVGAIAYGLGDYARASRALDEAIELEPLDGAARLYRALTLKALGRAEEAERELAFVAETASALRAEALLLRALSRLEVGDEIGGRRLLHEVVPADPGGELAERAQRMLEALEPREQRVPRIALSAQLGTEFDSNVTLDSGTDLTGLSTSRNDGRIVWGGGVWISGPRREWGGAGFGYRYSQSAHADLDDFDLQTHELFTSFDVRTPVGLTLRLDALGADVHLGGDRYLRSWTLRPNFLLPLSRELGVSRLYLDVTRRAYQDSPVVSSLDRDGVTYALGLEQHGPVPRWGGGLWNLGVSIARTNTEASTDLLGFEGDYDNRRLALAVGTRLPLRERFDLSVSGGLSFERYVNRNLLDAIADGGTERPSRRRDAVGEASVALGWSLSPALRLEARWQGQWSHSNVDVYDFTRNVFGLYLIAQRSWR